MRAVNCSLISAAGRFGVVGDVGLGGPLGVRGIGGELQQLRIGAIDEGLGLGDGGRLLIGGVLGEGERRGSENQQRKKQAETHGGKYKTSSERGGCEALRWTRRAGRI